MIYTNKIDVRSMNKLFIMIINIIIINMNKNAPNADECVSVKQQKNNGMDSKVVDHINHQSNIFRTKAIIK